MEGFTRDSRVETRIMIMSKTAEVLMRLLVPLKKTDAPEWIRRYRSRVYTGFPCKNPTMSEVFSTAEEVGGSKQRLQIKPILSKVSDAVTATSRTSNQKRKRLFKGRSSVNEVQMFKKQVVTKIK